MRIGQLDQNVVVTVKKKFAESKLVLIPLTSIVSVSESKNSEISIGEFKTNGKTFNIGLKSANTSLVNSSGKIRKEAFVSTFWILNKYKTDDARKANCELTDMQVTVAVGQERLIITVPTITNSKALEPLEELVLLSKEDVHEPAKKKKTRK